MIRNEAHLFRDKMLVDANFVPVPCGQAEGDEHITSHRYKQSAQGCMQATNSFARSLRQKRWIINK
eukprot:2844869-Amphidinium_carterae.1